MASTFGTTGFSFVGSEDVAAVSAIGNSKIICERISCGKYLA